MSPEDFDAHFNRFTRTAFRLETFQDYGERERVQAFLAGQPRAERSVRTSPWLARIAVSTVNGKRWQRVRVVDEPLNAYTRYEIAGYVESQAAGEEIRIVLRGASPDMRALRHDFWLFDAGTPEAYALLMDYGHDGQFRDAELITDPDGVLECVDDAIAATKWSVPLNEYLAERARKAA